MPEIRNQNDLVKMLEKTVEEVIEKVAKDLLDVFRERYIMEMVYNSHGANAVYDPSYEFYNAWEWEDLKKSVHSYTKKMWYNPSEMGFEPAIFKHGSRYSTPPDVRDNLMDILNKKGWSSSLWLSVWRPKAYWNEFIKDMFSKKELKKMFDAEFKSRGMIVK